MESQQAVEILVSYLQQDHETLTDMRLRSARDLLNRVRAGDKTPTRQEINRALLATGDLDATTAQADM